MSEFSKNKNPELTEEQQRGLEAALVSLAEEWKAAEQDPASFQESYIIGTTEDGTLVSVTHRGIGEQSHYAVRIGKLEELAAGATLYGENVGESEAMVLLDGGTTSFEGAFGEIYLPTASLGQDAELNTTPITPIPQEQNPFPART